MGMTARAVEPQDGSCEPDLLQKARSTLWARRARPATFGSEITALMGEPAYDMLLDLYVAFRTDKPMFVGDACIASGGAPTTALRIIDQLVTLGVVEKWRDQGDRRCRLLRLTPRGADVVERHLRSLIA